MYKRQATLMQRARECEKRGEKNNLEPMTSQTLISERVQIHDSRAL